ncbi:probable ATP-dependent RNA helicase DDX52 [Halichondria panicea]|uniref:probable ATP-dependent RNA helicase DDX52 n=1 Tax=Halichondria panicea TaxID=6063 RepID=UPI00312B4D8B
MVDTYQLFRKLSSGAKFKKSNYLERTKTQPVLLDGESVADALDFFGDRVAASSSVSSVAAHTGRKRRRKVSETVESDTCEGGGSCEGSDACEDDSDDEVCDSREGGVGVELLAGVKLGDGTTKNKRKKKKKKLDRETKELLRRQEANAFRNSHRIYISGPDVPDPVASFQQLPLPSYLIRNIAAVGYATPTPIQMQGIPLMLNGRELVACAPTGSGKTAAFIAPILAHLKTPQRSGFRALVISPTRELAQQTFREFNRLSAGSGFKVHVLTKANANSFGPQSSQRFDILVSTPNRLVQMLTQHPPAISLSSVEWLVLDEADKLFEDGDFGFRDQVTQIYTSCDHPDVRHALFSATLASGVEEFSYAHFENPVRVIIGIPNSAAELVKQELLFVGQESGKLLAIRDLVKKGFSPPMLIFVQSKERAKDLFHELIYDGLNVDVIHSERTQAQRDNVVKAFRAGKIWVLICTDLLGRGIDFKGVNIVVNYDCPPSAISYIHRIGRTGRAGREGRAITLFTEADSLNLRSIANVMTASGDYVPPWILELRKPSKNTRKELSKRPLVREGIKTASKYDLQRSRKKKDMVEGSKRRMTLTH